MPEIALRGRMVGGTFWSALLAVSVLGAGSDLAALGEPAASGSRLSTEPRLATRLMVRVPGVSLRELLPHFSQATGTSLTVAPDAAEEKVVVFGPSRPAWETLDDLAALLDLRWERVGPADGAPQYRLARPPGAVRRLAALRLETVRQVQAAVDAHARALAESPEQLRRRPEKDFSRIMLSDPEWRWVTELYALLSPRQREELFTRRELRFPLSSLSPPQQGPLRQAYARRVEQEDAFFNSAEGMDVVRKAGPTGHVVRHRPEDLERNALRIQALRADGYISVGMNLGSGPTVSSASVDEEGKFSFAVNGWPITLVDTRLCWVLPPHGSPYGPVEEERRARTPFAEAATTGKPSRDWVDRLRSLAEEAGRPVLADYYLGARCNRSPDPSPAPTPEDDVARLDRFCAEAQYLWWTRGSTLLLRKRDWITQAAYEVPDQWLTRTAGRLDSRNGAVTSADVVLLSELSAAQLDGLSALARGGWTNDSSDSEAMRKVLLLAASRLRNRERPIPADGRLVVTLGDLAPTHRRSVAQLGEGLGWKLSPAEMNAFRLGISTGPRTNYVSGDYLPVNVEFEYGLAHRMRSQVYLPLRVPADRRDTVLVEKAP